MSEKVLILSTSAGAGHLRAAEAVELALRETAPEVEVKNVDVLTLATRTFKRLYGEAYLDLVNKAPHVLGYFYDLMDRPVSEGAQRDRLRLAYEKLNMRPFVKLMRSERWDIVINTHFLPAEIIASLRRSGGLRLPQVTVTTDFETHRLWVHSPCERYFTATDEGAEYLSSWGVPRRRIQVTGIPIHPVFSREKPRADCLARQGLIGDRPVILQLAGGFGVGPIERIFRSILDVEAPLEIAVVCGRNEQAKAGLEKLRIPSRHRARILGFTKEMDELMGACDLVVTKPGGLTSSEALARGAAMAIVNPIPGQESRNSDYLLENGAAIKINNVATLTHKISSLLADAGRLEALKANARRLGRPRAAYEVVESALELARSRKSRSSGKPGRRS